MRNIKWLLTGLLGAVVWFELFIRWPVESVVLLVAVSGWLDYMRRRRKLRPPDL